MKSSDSNSATTVKTLLAIAGIAFAVNLVVTAVLRILDLPPDAVLAAAIFSLVLTVPLYFLVVRPLRIEYEKRSESHAEVTQPAITDPLTHIMNRRGITVSLLDAMAQAERYDTPLSVAMGDIDYFKNINEKHGREVGDKVLAQIASVLSDALRMPDKVGRYGGEEFLVIFPHTTLAQARKIAERMRTEVQKSDIDFGAGRAEATISLGVTQFQRGEDLEQLLSRADAMLSRAKSGGRNLVVAQKASHAGAR